MDYGVPIFLILGLVLFSKLWKARLSRSKNHCRLLFAPEPKGALPIIGHLHLLGTHKTFARTLGAIADNCGPIFTIWLGVHRAIVVSDAAVIKECFTTKDKVLASRPRSSHGEYLSYNYAAFGFAPYGPYWRDIRKLATVQLLSSHRLKSFRHVQVSEVNALIKDLFLLCRNNIGGGSTNVVISECLTQLSMNTIMRIIAGKRCFGSLTSAESYGEGNRIGKIMREFMYISGVLVPSDLIPGIGWMNRFLGPVNTMKRLSKEFDCLLESWIEEHKQERLKINDSNITQDFIHVMLAELEDSKFGHSQETIIKGTALTLILAGADTTSITLTWILSNLLNNPRVMKLAQEELDNKVGRERWAEESDIERLIYLQAIVKETLRLYPPGPVSVPHEASEECSIGGYHIPKGTRVFTNLWKLHRDPKLWSNPDEFLPERFLTSRKMDVDVSGQYFEFIPFGSGRRICPGITFAMQLMHLTLAQLLQGFSMTTPMNVGVDMTEGFGISMPKTTPLEVQIMPRLCPELYEIS